MELKRVAILFLLALSFSIPVFSQGELDEQAKIFYRNEKSWAIFINTNGFGGNFRKGTRINVARKSIWEIDMHYVKHPKEIKISNSTTQLNQYNYGKVNFAWETRGGLGFQREIFRKIDKRGVAVRYFYNGGPSIILLKPIYYEVFIRDNQVEDQKFDRNAAQYIVGKSSFFKGMDEIKANPGVYLKGGFSFEYSKRDSRLQALEVGGVVSAFYKEVELMAGNNSRFMFSLFVSFRWGRIIQGGNLENLEIEESF